MRPIALVFGLGGLAIVALMVFGESSRGESPPLVELPPTAFEVVRVRIHDADTISGDVLLPWGIALTGRSVRAAGYDAWEVDRTRKTAPFNAYTDAQWNAETERGIKARDELKKLANGGSVYVEWVRGADNSVYGRLEGPLWVRTSAGQVVNVKRWAEQSGHVRQ